MNDIAEYGHLAERFARVDVRHVHFDDRHAQDCERIAQPVVVMGPCSRVDHDGGEVLLVRSMNTLAHDALVIAVERFDADVEFRRELA